MTLQSNLKYLKVVYFHFFLIYSSQLDAESIKMTAQQYLPQSPLDVPEKKVSSFP